MAVKRAHSPARHRPAQRPHRPSAPEIATTTSPAAVLSFLKQSAQVPAWTTGYLARVLGLSRDAAQRVAHELAAVGYIEPVSGKRDTWRNTEAGDTVAGAKEPRLTRATADKAVREFLDRINQVNSDDRFPVRATKAIAFGGYTTKHERIQDVEVAVALEPKRGSSITPEQERETLTFLKGRGRALKLVRLSGWMLAAPGRVLFDAGS